MLTLRWAAAFALILTAAGLQVDWRLTDAIADAVQRAGEDATWGSTGTSPAAAWLQANATERSITFYRSADDSLWILPQQLSAVERSEGGVQPAATLCTFTGAASDNWLRIAPVSACAAQLLTGGSCDGLLSIEVVTSSRGAPPPRNVLLLPASTVYVPDLDVMYAFGGMYSVAASSNASATAASQPPGFDPTSCVEITAAFNSTYLAPHVGTYMYDPSRRAWTAWNMSVTGLATPNATAGVHSCVYTYGLTLRYSHSLHALVAMGPYGTECEAPLMYVFNLTTTRWISVLTTLPGCADATLISGGMYVWLDPGVETTLVIFGGTTLGHEQAGYTCFSLDVRTGVGVVLQSCTYGGSPDGSEVPLLTFDMAAGTVATAGGVAAVALSGRYVEADTSIPMVYMSEQTWLLQLSGADPSWQLGNTLVDATADTWPRMDGNVWIAWGGVLANDSSASASPDQASASYNWLEGGRCSRFFGGMYDFAPHAFGHPGLLHVIHTTYTPPLQADDALIMQPAVMAVVAVLMVCAAAVWLTGAAFAIGHNSNCVACGPADVVTLPALVYASAGTSLMNAAACVGVLSLASGPLLVAAIVWCGLHAACNVRVCMMTPFWLRPASDSVRDRVPVDPNAGWHAHQAIISTRTRMVTAPASSAPPASMIDRLITVGNVLLAVACAPVAFAALAAHNHCNFKSPDPSSTGTAYDDAALADALSSADSDEQLSSGGRGYWNVAQLKLLHREGGAVLRFSSRAQLFDCVCIMAAIAACAVALARTIAPGPVLQFVSSCSASAASCAHAGASSCVIIVLFVNCVTLALHMRRMLRYSAGATQAAYARLYSSRAMSLQSRASLLSSVPVEGREDDEL